MITLRHSWNYRKLNNFDEVINTINLKTLLDVDLPKKNKKQQIGKLLLLYFTYSTFLQ